MNDVTIKAPKVAISVPQVQSWLAIVNMVKDVLIAQKIQIPGAIADAITKLNQIGIAVSQVQAPTNLDAMLEDLLVILKSVEVTTGQGVLDKGISDVIAAVTWTQTGLNNLESGQFATVATGKVSIHGKEVEVANLLCRMDEGPASIAAGFQAPGPDALLYTQADLDAKQKEIEDANATIATLNGQVQALQAQVAASKPSTPASAPPEPPQGGTSA